MGFVYEAVRAPIAVLEVVTETGLGGLTATLPAEFVGAVQDAGAGVLTLNLAALPAGRCQVTLVLVDREERRSVPFAFGLDVPGGQHGAAGPVLRAVRAEQERLTRPDGDDLVNAWFAVACERGGSALAGVYVRVSAPDGRQAGFAAPLPPQAGELDAARLRLIVFGATEALGAYRVAVTVLDADGNASETQEAAVELVEAGGGQGPRVDGFEPVVAAAGETMTVHGGGFDGEELAVLVGDVRADLLAVAPDRLTLLAPPVDQPAQVAVVTRDGWGTSQVDFVPRIAVRVVPERFELPEGDAIQLTAVVSGTRDSGAGWRLDDAAGEVSPSGVYTAPPFSGPQTVRVTATSSADPQAVATATGSLVARPPTRGPARLGLLGGTVLSEDGGSTLVVPVDALEEPAVVEIQRVAADLADEAVDAEAIIVAAARVLPDGLELRRPAELTIPLRTYLEPDASIALQALDVRTNRWTDLDELGLVIDGDRLRIEQTKFYGGVRALHHLGPLPRSFAPAISGVAPPALEEGATAAVLVTGKNFVPGATTLTVLDAVSGQVEPRVDVRTIFVTADGTRLGVTLKAGVMTDLAAGLTRPVTLRVSTPGGSASASLTVVGHDELDLPSGSRTLFFSQVFSRLTVGPGARLTVLNRVPAIDITVLERAQIDARFEASGGVLEVGPGTGGTGTRGTAGGGGGAGGVPSGGATMPGGGGAGGAGGANGATPGAAGGAGLPSPATGAGGGGGPGGAGGGGGPFPHVADDGVPGGAASPFPPLPGVVPALTPGPGGGGGGGGGGEGWLSTNTGGGGGGGGAGGGALRLSAGEELVINGDVFALGGNGGGGAYPYPYSPPAPTFLISAGRGAGGGGGAGGALQLHGARWQSGFVLALGGESFRLPIYTSGPFPVDIRTAFERLLDQPATGRIRFDGPRPGQQVVPAPFSGPDLDSCFNLVSPSPQFQLKGHGTAGTLQVRVRDRLGNEQVAFPPAVDPVTGFTVAVPLYDGFNDIQAEFVLFGPPDVVWAVSAPVRSRTVLYLPGTTPSFAFACSISPATVTVPTERTVSFAVTVTGTPLTAVTWSVDGGAANGAVSQAGAYTAPCAAPSAPATVRVRSALDPSKSCTAQV
ncbi:MAG TPA: hypothetical protein VEP73_02450, partial [Actinomycetota bacterium]|nr:hypothetical protein [Actinomycetota bacterium]